MVLCKYLNYIWFKHEKYLGSLIWVEAVILNRGTVCVCVCARAYRAGRFFIAEPPGKPNKGAERLLIIRGEGKTLDEASRI